MSRKLTLILGGARSGKSSYAQKLAAENGGAVLYVATAEALDPEMAERIAAHRAERPQEWRTLEAPLGTGSAISRNAGDATIIIVDCMTMLASNVISPLPEPISYATAQKALMWEIADLEAAYRNSSTHWIIVSNEIGLGVVPPYPVGRVFRDALGRANQQLAALADEVLFMVAGLPMILKPQGPKK